MHLAVVLAAVISLVVQPEPATDVAWVGGTHSKIAARAGSLPIHGRQIVVSSSLDGSVVRTKGALPQTIELDPTPTFSPGDAVRLARELTVAMYGATGQLWTPRAELRVLLDDGDRATLVWWVAVSSADPIGSWEVLVDAQDGHALGLPTPTLHTARGNIYPTNPDVSELEEAELLRLDPTATGMEGDWAFVNTCSNYDGDECDGKTRLALEDADGDYLYDPDPGSHDDPFAEVQMYYHLDLVSQWFWDRHGFDHPLPIEGVVNFDYDNAFFGDIDGDGQGEVAFGTAGNGVDFSYDADVIYHEFGHSVFGRIAGQTGFIGADEFGTEWATGGLNEGTADLFTLVLTGDPELGEYAANGFGLGLQGSIRNLEADRHCPTDLYGESHRDGEVFGAFGWNLLEDPLLDADLVGDYIYGSVAAFPVNANWEDASDALWDVADDMLAAGMLTADQHDAIAGHLEASGLVPCGRVIRIDEDQEPQQLMVGVGIFPEAWIPAGNQFSLDAPEGTTRIRFRVKNWLSSDHNLHWVLFVRRGEHVFHDVQPIETPFGNIDVPFPETYDYVIEGEGGEFEINFELDSDEYPLEVGATYYFSLATRVDGSLGGFFAQAEITVDGRTWYEEPPAGDDDDDAADDDDGAGCSSCSSSMAGRSAPLAWLGLVALLGLLRVSRSERR